MSAFSKLKAYHFAILMAKPFSDWEEFKKGWIDKKGKYTDLGIKNKKSVDVFRNLVRKIKLILLRYVPDSKALQFMISLYLLKEDEDNSFNNSILYDIIEILTESEISKLDDIFDDLREI